MIRTSDGWIEEYKKKAAYWVHDGNKDRPHAVLTSGFHSGGFFNSREVIQDGVLLRDAASDLLELFDKNGGDVSKVEMVVGPQTGATKLAEFLSDQIGASSRGSCLWASPSKCEIGGEKSMQFTKEELDLLPGKTVLLCEDVCTTGGSVDRTAAAVINGGGIVLPYILVLVNRSGFKEASGNKIVALIDHPMPTWEPGNCPLCQSGSEPLRAKDNWARLNAAY